MKVKINNEHEFSFLESITLNEFHNHLLNKVDSYHILLNRLEDYERNYTYFNIIELLNIMYQSAQNQILITMKVNDLLAYNKSPFYYKTVTVRF